MLLRDVFPGGSDHFLRVEYLVKLLGGKETELNASLLKRYIVLVCLFCGLCGILITDIGIEGGDQHQRIVQVMVHLVLVCGNTYGTVLVEGYDSLGEKS